jgi:predicted acetyltransferase
VNAATAFAVPASAGATELRIVTPDDAAMAAIADLLIDAYTLISGDTREKREHYVRRLRERTAEPGMMRIAAYRDGMLAGTMAWYDFTMRLRTRDVFAGGIGAVAVAFEARRRGVARELVQAFVEAYAARGAALALLHPFRHDFYRNKGFGYGTKMNRYRFAPEALPGSGRADRVRVARGEDDAAVAACYERVRAVTNGLIATSVAEFRERLDDLGQRVFVYADDAGTVRGYALARPVFDEARSVPELRVYEPICEEPAALAALLAFFRGLGDQFRTIIVVTQDETLYFVSSDPRSGEARPLHPPAYHETNAQGSGVMYRVLDIPAALAAAGIAAYAGQGARATVTVADAILGERSLPFEAQIPGLERDVAVALDVADFSSLVVGSVRLRALHAYSLAHVSDPAALPALDAAFAADLAPRCTTAF